MEKKFRKYSAIFKLYRKYQHQIINKLLTITVHLITQIKYRKILLDNIILLHVLSKIVSTIHVTIHDKGHSD